jgi:gamma-glutamylcyclotransferase (GGCT)/AIG2-like uncharacterized protein YtfP
MKKILVYGSLREGDYNFERVKNLFGEDSIKKIGEKTLSGFAIFDLGHYPGLNETGNEDHKVLFDVLEVNEKAFNFIQRMELGAGYNEKMVDDLTMYVYNYTLDPNTRVLSGDWITHKKETLRL